MSLITRAACAAAFSLLASGSVFAQGYAGIAAGVSHVDVDCAGTTQCDRNDTAFKVFGGYKFTPNIALEVNYLNFGKAKLAGPVPGIGGVAGDVKVSGFGVGAAFFAELATDWSGVARLGVASMKTKISATAGSLSGSDHETKTKPYVGLGVGYALSKSTTLDLAADFSRGEYQGEKTNVRAITLGLTYAF